MNTPNIESILLESLDYGKKFINNGNVATYIPELGSVDKNLLGATIITSGGKTFHAGDWKHNFTIQSISKVISLIFALEKFGPEIVFSKVGVEASGDSFNSIARLETKSKYPTNPFINAGAIAVSGLIANNYSIEDFLDFMCDICGQDSFCIDENVYLSECKTGSLNRSIAYYLNSNNILEGNVEEILKFYFKICSIKVNTYQLAVLSNLLATNSSNKCSNHISKETLKITKSIMMTCGMYDGSGEFAVRVGMPAKSGVGGGIIASCENRMGIAVFGPSLDSNGNSIAGYHILEYLSKKLELHSFNQ